MDRWERRKTERFLESIKIKAKKYMITWAAELGREPSIEEAEAWKQGYIAGINRMTNNKENNK